MPTETIIVHQGQRFLVDEGDQILEAERERNVWHVVRLTADGQIDIRVFWLQYPDRRLWAPSPTKGASFHADRLHSALVCAIGTEAEKAAWLDSTDGPFCRVINTPWNDNPNAKVHTSNLPGLQGDVEECLHCSLASLADLIPATDRDFETRLLALGVPPLFTANPDLHLQALVSRPDWLAAAFKNRFDEAVYREYRDHVLTEALAYAAHMAALRERPKQSAKKRVTSV